MAKVENKKLSNNQHFDLNLVSSDAIERAGSDINEIFGPKDQDNDKW